MSTPAASGVAPPQALPPGLGPGNRNSVKFLRACFKKQVLGGGRTSAPALRFWTAVNAFAPGLNAQLDKPGSSRTMAELQAAYDLVSTLLYDDPAALFLFLSNGSPGVSNEVPGLHSRVEGFLAALPPPPQPPVVPAAGLASPAGAVAEDDDVSPDRSMVASPGDGSEGEECAAGPPGADSCYLCLRPQTTSNPVSVGKISDLQTLWRTCSKSYVGLMPSMMCPTRSSNHTHCRGVLRAMVKSAVQVPPPVLDAMARCYPLQQLEEYLAPRAAFKTHRRCRGGLLSLFRVLETLRPSGADGTVRGRLPRAVCGLDCTLCAHSIRGRGSPRVAAAGLVSGVSLWRPASTSCIFVPNLARRGRSGAQEARATPLCARRSAGQ